MLINIKYPEGLITDLSKITMPRYVVMNEFDNYSSSDFSRAFNDSLNSPQDIVCVNIDSPGGSCYALFGILDALAAAKKPVLTYTGSMCFSAALVMLSAGTKGLRFASENATLLLHEASTVLEGKNADIINDAQEMDRINDRLLDVLAKNSNKPKSFYRNMISKNKNADIYIDAKTALEYGIIDHIGVPTLETVISAEYQITVAGKKIERPVAVAVKTKSKKK